VIVRRPIVCGELRDAILQCCAEKPPLTLGLSV
jgi:hypothetical protein